MYFQRKVPNLAILRRNTYMSVSALGASHTPAEIKKTVAQSSYEFPKNTLNCSKLLIGALSVSFVRKNPVFEKIEHYWHTESVGK